MPPVTVKSMTPDVPKLQVVFVTTADTEGGVFKLTTPLAVPVQPLKSVTVTV